MIVAPGTGVCGCGWAVFSNVRCGRCGGTGGSGCRSSLRRRRGRHGVVRPQPGGVNQSRRPRHRGGGQTCVRPRVLAAPERRSRRSGQATDVPVAQPVVDQGEQLAGGGDLGDVRAAAFGQPGPGGPIGPPWRRCTASTAAQRTRWLPCLVIRPRWTLVSDSRWRGVIPAQEHSCCGAGEAGHVTDLGDEHRGQHRPDAGDGLDRLEAGVAGQLAAGALGQNVDLERERVDQPAQREHPGVERRRPGPARRAAAARRRRTGPTSARCTPCLASTACTWALSPERSATSLHRCRTASRSSRTCRRGDPRLGQPAHPQQIGKITRRRARRS